MNFIQAVVKSVGEKREDEREEREREKKKNPRSTTLCSMFWYTYVFLSGFQEVVEVQTGTVLAATVSKVVICSTLYLLKPSFICIALS